MSNIYRIDQNLPILPAILNNQAVEKKEDIDINQLPKVSYCVQDDDDIFDYNSDLSVISRLALKIFSVIFFPVGLTLLTKRTFSYLLARNHILPALKQKKAQLDLIREEFLKNHPLADRCKRKVIQTADQVKLDTMIIHHPDQKKKANAARKYILFLNNGKETYESMLSSLMTISEETGASIYTGNYRGVGYSKGCPTGKKDLFMDAEAMVQCLIAKGVRSENILIHGWDLGANVGGYVATLHQEKGREMNFCSDRSYLSTTKHIKECANKKIIRLKKENPRMAKWAVRPIKIMTFLKIYADRIFGWNFKNLSDYKAIEGHKFIIYHRHDSIPYKASLFKGFKEKTMTAEEKREKLERKIQKIECRIEGREYVRDPKKRNYRPLQVVRLGNDIEKKRIHDICINQTAQFNEYKNQVAIAFA